MNSEYNNLKNEIIKIIIKHPLLIIFYFPIIIGGLIIIIYLAEINFLPTINSSDIVVLLLFSFIIGFLLFIIILAIMIMPISIYQSCDLLEKFEKIIKRKHLLKYKKKKGNYFSKILLACYKNSIIPYEERYNPQFKLLFIPLMINLIAGIFLYWCFFSENYFYFLSGETTFCIYLFIVFYTLNRIFINHYNLVFKPVCFIPYDNPLYIIYLIRLLFSTVILFITFFFIYLICKTGTVFYKNEYELVFICIVFIGVLICINITQKKFFLKILITSIFVITYMFVTKSITFIPNIIMHSFNIGQVNMNKIVLNIDGCRFLDINSINDFCEIKNAKVLWGRGEVVLIELSENENMKKRYHIPYNQIKGYEEIVNIKNNQNY